MPGVSSGSSERLLFAALRNGRAQDSIERTRFAKVRLEAGAQTAGRVALAMVSARVRGELQARDRREHSDEQDRASVAQIPTQLCGGQFARRSQEQRCRCRLDRSCQPN